LRSQILKSSRDKISRNYEPFLNGKEPVSVQKSWWWRFTSAGETFWALILYNNVTWNSVVPDDLCLHPLRCVSSLQRNAGPKGKQ